MNLNINIFILLFGALQGLLILFFLLRRPQNRLANLFLGGYVLVLICQILMKVAQKTWIREHFLWVYDISYLLPLLYAPLVYLYIRQYLNLDKLLKINYLYHFAPFVLLTFIHSFYWLFPEVFYKLFSYPIKLSTQVCILGIYFFFIAKTIRQWQNQNQAKFLVNKTQISWLQTFNHLNLWIGISISTALVFLHAFHPQYAEYRMLFLSLTIFIYWLSYQALVNSLIFNGLTVKEIENEKYAHSKLSCSEAEAIYNQLQALMKQEKYYLDTDLSLQKLANLLQISKHTLSQVLNEVPCKNYYDFINEYRVKEAQNLLLNPDKQHLTIAALAFEAGFNSLSAFNEIFKKHTQLTPTQFRKKMLIIS